MQTLAQSAAAFSGSICTPIVDAPRCGGSLRLLKDDIARMSAGRAALADTAPELAAAPPRLTVTVGFGPSLFDKVGLAAARPAALPTCPRSRPSIGSTPPTAAGTCCCRSAPTTPWWWRTPNGCCSRTPGAFATAKGWTQRGLPQRPAGQTGRNLMGQVDGTVNPRTDADFDRVVWSTGTGWFTGGTFLVFRRIRMELDTWDELDRSAMEATIGRRLSTGAPLTGTAEHDEPDLDAVDATGLHAIADFAHLRLARGDGPAAQLLRRPYSRRFAGRRRSQRRRAAVLRLPGRHRRPVRADATARLAAGDLLNQWITPVGSAAIPPGCAPGGFLAEGMFS
ncbi:MAG: Dyp-type peroxidase [Nakamurella multipartita]